MSPCCNQQLKVRDLVLPYNGIKPVITWKCFYIENVQSFYTEKSIGFVCGIVLELALDEATPFVLVMTNDLEKVWIKNQAVECVK